MPAGMQAGVAPGRRALLAGGLLALAARPAAAAQARHVFDQRHGWLEFTARHLGLLDATGRFEDFSAELLWDPRQPLAMALTVEVRTAAIAMPMPGAVVRLRSPDFFDVERYPEARFTGGTTGAGSADGFALAGALTLRGTTRPFGMEARLAWRDRQVVEFSAEGEMRRSEYGMTADRAIISDTIRLGMRAALTVA